MLRLEPATQAKLDHNVSLLALEFRNVPMPEVAHEVESIAETLLENAHFDDYIPVLTHRFAREHFRERLANAA